jgi:predicted RND superfamily exporter protein
MAELARADSAPRIAYNMVDEHMAGAQTISVMIDTGVSDGLMEPDILRAMEYLQAQITERYDTEVSRTYSLANIVKDTYQAMNRDDPEYYRIPDSSVAVSQLMYLFNSANPEERRSLVSDDFSRSHITINAYNAGSYRYQQFFDELGNEIDAVFGPLQLRYPELQVTVTGSVALMMRAMDEIAQSQYSSFLLALGVISVIMIITLGSAQAGLISIVPNLIPALLTFGLMGLLGITLDTDTLLIAPVIIGVAVDDTIHFMTSYRLELIKTRSMQQALYNTLHDVGRAVMFTTMILGLGFAILSFSEYLGIAKIGIFGGLAIFMALLCDLLLLPAMLMILKPRFGLSGPLAGFGQPALIREQHHETA